jgi:hypothetical protein
MQAEFAKMQYQHQARMEELALQAQLNGNANAEKAQVDAVKEQMALEKQAIELDTARVQANSDKVKANVEMVKSVNSMMQPEVKKNEDFV